MYDSLINAIGNTPLVRMPLDCPGLLYAKLEFFNPGGSQKDRSALYMIEEAERNGSLKSGGTIVDASSGNHGISVAMIGALKGYKVIITLPEKTSPEKIKILKAYGAEVILCPEMAAFEDPKGYHGQAVAINQSTPNSFMPNQYFNVACGKSHYKYLGPEIWQQTNGAVTHLFAGVGTGGTISGVGRYLKEQNPNIQIIAIDMETSFRATGGNPQPYEIEDIGIDLKTPVLDESVIDEFRTVSDKNGIGILPILAHAYGFFVGTSSGAVVYASREYAQEKMKPGDLGVMVLGDSGRAYLSKKYYDK